MAYDALLIGGAAALLLLLGLKLRGPRGRPDLTGPPKRGRKRLSPGDARRLRTLVAQGREDEALRMIRALGYDEADARKLVRFVARLTETEEEPQA